MSVLVVSEWESCWVDGKIKHKGNVFEFDLRSILVYFASRFFFVYRIECANRCAVGGLWMVYLSDGLSEFVLFVQVEFLGIPEESIVCYAQSYVVRDVLIIVMPIVVMDGS